MSGTGAIPKANFDNRNRNANAKNSQAQNQKHKSAQEKPPRDQGQDQPHEFPPLESRFVEYKSENAVINRAPALSKQWAPPPTTKWVDFYLPELELQQLNHAKDDHPHTHALSIWVQYMELLIDDLKWLLKLKHHQFWSVLVHSPPISQEVLPSFLKYAPRFYDKNYASYERHPIIWPIYKEIYVLVFRIFMRLATFKESKEDHITPQFWSALLHDHKLITFSTLSSLSTLYESKENPVFQKMVHNLIQHEPRLIQEMRAGIPLLIDKFRELSNQIETLLVENLVSPDPQNSWAPEKYEKFEEILWFKLDGIYSLYKFLKAYPQAAKVLLHYPNFVSSMAASYEANARRWGKIIVHMPNLEDRVALCRAAILRLFRCVLATSTLLSVESANDKRLDEFFDYFSNCIDEKIFIHDYEKSFPFKSDMQALLSRGIFVDETRIDYMANAISSCFHSCGEEYSVEKIVIDPLYDPHFDRQLLGACSLEVTGIELQSLITQVKDLLPEIPDSYIEAVLKHYSYSTETTINALLEGSVPTRLDKYKSQDYVSSLSRSCSNQSLAISLEEPVQDKLPVPFPGQSQAQGQVSSSFKELVELSSSEKEDLKQKILQSCDPTSEESERPQKLKPKSKSKYGYEEEDQRSYSYVDESLLPKFSVSVEYDDEYDDTYDDVGAGMTEPDNNLFNPLNKRKFEIQGGRNSPSPEDEDEDGESGGQSRGGGGRGFDAFCEDPALVRERFERRRQEAQSRRGGGGGGGNRGYGHNPQQQQTPPERERDVVGRAKGQGQEKDVVYNRRQKTANKGGGGSYKKRSDFKRKEF